MGIGKLRSRRRRPRRWLGVSGKRQLDPDKMQKQGSRERGKVIKQIRKKRKSECKIEKKEKGDEMNCQLDPDKMQKQGSRREEK